MIRALGVLASTLEGDAHSCTRERIGGVDALVARPRGRTGPVVVYANAATPLGVDEPAVGRFLGALGAAGFVAVAPELPHVRLGEVTPETVATLVDVAGASGSRVTLVGASTGAGLAILAAADPHLASRLNAVLAIAPYASLERILRLATTGFYGDGRYETAPRVSGAAIRSLASCAPDDPAVPALVMNTDPKRFDDLFAALDARTRALVEELSPESAVARVSAPVEVLADPDDTFFPVEEARSLARVGRDVRLTVTPALDHIRPRLRPGLLRLALAVERTLRRTARPHPPATLQASAE